MPTNLLVAVDFSAVTDRVIETAAALAQECGGTITLLHVARAEPDFVGYEAGPQSVRDQVATEFRLQRRMLHDLADRLRAAQVEATPLVVQGGIADSIVEQAERSGSALIVVGTHGRGPMMDLLVGSVSEGVIRRSPVPVVVVPPERS